MMAPSCFRYAVCKSYDAFCKINTRYDVLSRNVPTSSFVGPWSQRACRSLSLPLGNSLAKGNIWMGARAFSPRQPGVSWRKETSNKEKKQPTSTYHINMTLVPDLAPIQKWFEWSSWLSCRNLSPPANRLKFDCVSWWVVIKLYFRIRGCQFIAHWE